MANLIVHHKPVETVFNLIGDLENDITKSIAWAFVKCPLFLETIIYDLLAVEVNADDIELLYQDYEKDKGITDLTITDYKNIYIIIEAKRGWILPGEDQLRIYSERTDYLDSKAVHKAIASMSECSMDYANAYLPKIKGVDIRHLPWIRICELAAETRKKVPYKERGILEEIERYIRGIMTTQNPDTNKVYVVSLGKDLAQITTPEREKLTGDITYVDIVKKYNKYCCPIGGKGGWPKEPLTYIAFRYDGKLQGIHHIEGYHIADNLHEYIPELPDANVSETHFVYELGPAIMPQKEVRTGKRITMSMRVWARIDALLTCDTIEEARDVSKEE